MVAWLAMCECSHKAWSVNSSCDWTSKTALTLQRYMTRTYGRLLRASLAIDLVLSFLIFLSLGFVVLLAQLAGIGGSVCSCASRAYGRTPAMGEVRLADHHRCQSAYELEQPHWCHLEMGGKIIYLMRCWYFLLTHIRSYEWPWFKHVLRRKGLGGAYNVTMPSPEQWPRYMEYTSLIKNLKTAFTHVG